jgi:mannose-6-phosphate isomerase-like protein (cupin superfamily)
MEKTEKNETEIKLKPWGREIWFAHTDKYAGKILEIKKGHRYSLQYHEKKEETQYIYKGQAKFTYGTEESNLQEKILNKGDKIDVRPYTIHRLEAIEDTEVFEVSTPELNDVVKLADDYGRSKKGNDEELDTKLHNSK